MNDSILDKLPDKIFHRDDLLKAIQFENTRANETTMRYWLSAFLKSNEILRVGRNRYIKADKYGLINYENFYSETAQDVILYMTSKYPMIEFRIWELYWMNEFVNHLMGNNLIFLEVEKNACEFIYCDISRDSKTKVLLKPTEKELTYYADTNTIIVIPLVSESPCGKSKRYSVPLEKIIVDLFANKMISISRSEYSNIICLMFEKYVIDFSKLFRYAKRRNKDGELRCFLKETLPQNIYNL